MNNDQLRGFFQTRYGSSLEAEAAYSASKRQRQVKRERDAAHIKKRYIALLERQGDKSFNDLFNRVTLYT